MKICGKCNRKNPEKLEVQDWSTGKMVWDPVRRCLYCQNSLQDSISLLENKFVCTGCNRKNPSHVEIQDLATGKMIWENVTRCIHCQKPWVPNEKKEKITAPSELDKLAQKLFKDDYEQEDFEEKKDSSAGTVSEPEKRPLDSDRLSTLRPLWKSKIAPLKKLRAALSKPQLVQKK